MRASGCGLLNSVAPECAGQLRFSHSPVEWLLRDIGSMADLAQEKQQLHELVDRLAPGQVNAVRGLLQVMLDPVSRAIANAPADDEALSAEDVQALGEAREWLRHNQPIPHVQVLADLGITQEEIESYQEPA